MDRLTIPFLGPERTTWQYPFGSLLRAGARLAMGSDWSVSTANPLLEIEVAVNRVADYDRTAEPFLPEERLTLDEALAGFTIGSRVRQPPRYGDGHARGRQARGPGRPGP